MGKYLEAVIEHLENGIKFKKCWKCGCQQNTIKAIEQRLSSFKEEDQKVLIPLLEKSKATFEKVEYDCLGCKLCFPAVITNELTQAYPNVNIEEEGCGPLITDESERVGWPPLPGNYETLRYQAPVAICTLNSKTLLPEIAKSQHPDVGVVGTLNTENLGIERIIKNVTSNPHIRFLILCGEDSEQKIGHLPGQTLSSLFKNGIDESKRIIGAQGKRPVLKNIEPPLVEQFRKQVELVNMIGCTAGSNVVQMAAFCAKKKPGPFEGGIAMSTPIPVIQAKPPKPLVLDPKGYFVIFPDKARAKIVVEHYHNNGALSQVIEGTDISHIYMTAIELELLSKLDHACYFGKELARAAESLKTGEPYQQDKAQDQPEDSANCAGKKCC